MNEWWLMVDKSVYVKIKVYFYASFPVFSAMISTWLLIPNQWFDEYFWVDVNISRFSRLIRFICCFFSGCLSFSCILFSGGGIFSHLSIFRFCCLIAICAWSIRRSLLRLFCTSILNGLTFTSFLACLRIGSRLLEWWCGLCCSGGLSLLCNFRVIGGSGRIVHLWRRELRLRGGSPRSWDGRLENERIFMLLGGGTSWQFHDRWGFTWIWRDSSRQLRWGCCTFPFRLIWWRWLQEFYLRSFMFILSKVKSELILQKQRQEVMHYDVYLFWFRLLSWVLWVPWVRYHVWVVCCIF